MMVQMRVRFWKGFMVRLIDSGGATSAVADTLKPEARNGRGSPRRLAAPCAVPRRVCVAEGRKLLPEMRAVVARGETTGVVACALSVTRELPFIRPALHTRPA